MISDVSMLTIQLPVVTTEQSDYTEFTWYIAWLSKTIFKPNTNYIQQISQSLKSDDSDLRRVNITLKFDFYTAEKPINLAKRL